MVDLYHQTLPMAPDYSGAASVFFDLNALLVVSDAGGCAGTVTGMDESRWFRNRATIVSLALREMETVFGQEERILRRIEQVFCDLDREMLVLIGSPVDALIGLDLSGLARKLEARIGKPVLAVQTNGFESYTQGIIKAFQVMKERFLEKKTGRIKNSLNILGASPLDLGGPGQLMSLVDMIEHSGWKVVASWGMSSSLDDIRRSLNAELNMVVSQTGFPLASSMYETHGIPFITGIPIGLHSQKCFHRFLTEWEERQAGKAKKEKSCCHCGQHRRSFEQPASVYVIGEPIRSRSLARCLRLDFGFQDVGVVSFGSAGKDTSFLPGEISLLVDSLDPRIDIDFRTEKDLVDVLHNQSTKIVVGDPHYRQLIDREDLTFIPLSHSAASGRIGWNHDVPYIGTEGFNYLNYFFNNTEEKTPEMGDILFMKRK